LARLAGSGGVLVLIVAAAIRAAGLYTVAGFAVGTLFLGAVGLMTLACLAYLAVLVESRP
jgi:hypothetical protein